MQFARDSAHRPSSLWTHAIPVEPALTPPPSQRNLKTMRALVYHNPSVFENPLQRARRSARLRVVARACRNLF
eukprot:3218416-Pyramimonas_sp.AAC.1